MSLREEIEALVQRLAYDTFDVEPHVARRIERREIRFQLEEILKTATDRVPVELVFFDADGDDRRGEHRVDGTYWDREKAQAIADKYNAMQDKRDRADHEWRKAERLRVIVSHSALVTAGLESFREITPYPDYVPLAERIESSKYAPSHYYVREMDIE